MSEEMKFVEFPKIHRLSRDIIITEKIDGTNAQITITEDMQIIPGSRNRFITSENDNYGFAKWCIKNRDDLLRLGIGTHYGEWWGNGIQRGYGLKEKKFSLFNVSRWNKELRPECCGVVPILWTGIFDTNEIIKQLKLLEDNGSHAAPGFMNPEGIVIFHIASGYMFKKTIKNDDKGKNQ